MGIFSKSDGEGPTGRHAGRGIAKSNPPDATYIGRHRASGDISHDSRGFSVGRGVQDQPEHNRSDR